jgi:hypothetical protein
MERLCNRHGIFLFFLSAKPDEPVFSRINAIIAARKPNRHNKKRRNNVGDSVYRL